MVHLTIDNCYTLVRVDSEEAKTLAYKIRGLVSYSPSKAFYAKSKWGKRDVCLMKKGLFPTGYLSELIKLLYREGITAKVTDKRQPPGYFGGEWSNLKGIELRPYQVTGIDTGLRTHRHIFSWPTGSGKTELLIALAKAINKPTLWLTSSVNVLSQTKRRILDRLGGEGGIAVALPEQVKSWNLSSYEVLIIDECHHAVAKTWYDVAMRCPAQYRFAVSATPFSTPDGNMQLRAAISCSNIHTVTYRDLYDQQYLSRPTVRIVNYRTENLRDVQTRNIGKVKTTIWHDVYKRGIALCDDRNKVAMSEIAHYLRRDIRPLVICRLIEDHAVPLAQHCIHAGWTTEIITGESADQERTDAIKQLISGKCDVLIATCILGEGQDIPDLQAVINLTAGDGVKQTLQIAGRTMRPQSPSYVSDFWDIHHKVLFRHSEARRSYYRTIQANIEEVTW